MTLRSISVTTIYLALRKRTFTPHINCSHRYKVRTASVFSSKLVCGHFVRHRALANPWANFGRMIGLLVPFNIACGKCVFCQQGLFGNCHNSNPQATAVGVISGYPHTAGGYDGGQAEYMRVPYADVSPTMIPEGMDPDDAVMLTDVVPTGYQAAEMGGIQPGDTVVVFGAGPVGIMAARCT